MTINNFGQYIVMSHKINHNLQDENDMWLQTTLFSM